MPPTKSRFVTASQQVLALAVVAAALTPAARVVSLDVVRHAPPGAGSTGFPAVRGELAAYTRESARTSEVPAQVVDPVVREVPLTAPADARMAPGALRGRVKAGAEPGTTVLTSLPQPVSGYGAVGVTWQHGVQVPEQDIAFGVRTATGGTWTTWSAIEYHGDHGPDADSAEGRHARPGTEEALVGDVDQVQVRSVSTGAALPADMSLAVIDPGTASTSTRELPAIDTARLDADPTAAPDTLVAAAAPAAQGVGSALRMSAAAYTPKPKIYSRAQWGADERMRDKGSLHYYEVHAGFVHHTVNANDYSRAEVPALLRSIYAYHTQSKGWSDIGYNFLVDRFGRIWEGRYGGVDRPVVGAHTLGYNDYAFAMSAIGNFDVVAPPQALIQAYGALFAWKLSLHGIDAADPRQLVGSKTFQAINGHRDAGQTACPGRYLYAKIPEIRRLAAVAQRDFAGRDLDSDLAGTAHPDLIVRRKSDGQGFLIPTGGLSGFQSPTAGSTGWSATRQVIASPDLTGDGRTDLVVIDADQTASVRPGSGAGGFGAAPKTTGVLKGRDLVTAVGDLDRDGNNDLVARNTATGRLQLLRGGGQGGFARVTLGSATWSGYDLLAGTGDLTGDGLPDLVARDTSGALWIHPGTGGRSLGARIRVPGQWRGYDTITGFGDYNRDGRADLVVRRKDTGDGYVLPGRGNATFGHALGPYPRLTGAGISGGGQLLGSSTPDLVARSGDRLVVVAGRGTIDLAAPIATGVDLSRADSVLAAGDWDRDGHGDIISRSAGNGSLALRRGDGLGHFAPATLLAGGFGGVQLLAAVGDMTGDGYPDLMGQPAGGSMRIYPGRGVTGLATSYPAYSPIDATAQVPVGRWDTDGAPDSLFRKGSTLTLYPGNGPGGLTGGHALDVDVTKYDWVVGVSDLGLTGHPDVIVRARGTGNLFLLPGSASGFGPRRFLGEGMSAYDLVG